MTGPGRPSPTPSRTRRPRTRSRRTSTATRSGSSARASHTWSPTPVRTRSSRRTHKGEFSTIAVLPGYSSFGFPSDPVPTSVVQGPDDAYYVSQLVGFPFDAGVSKIWRIVPGQAPTVYASGLTNVTDLAFAPDGTLYAVEIAKNGLLTGPPGAIVSIPGVAVRRPSWSTACCSPTGSPSATARSTSRRERRCPASDRCCASGSDASERW